jgi:regulator of protease activity HflC (stomatin/prohibitin superfamily)
LRSAVTQVDLEDLVANRACSMSPYWPRPAPSPARSASKGEQLGIRDLVVPGEQRRLLAQIVEARLSGQAALERARGETAAMRNLANAASMIRDNPEPYRLRLLQETATSTGTTFHIGTEPS